jgi:spermidine synthase
VEPVRHETLARVDGARGEVVVRRRADGALELRVNGVFVMDTAETASERLLARAALAATEHPRRVLVGGLGIGFTLRELLADRRVEQVVVAEVEPAVVDWMRCGLLPGADLLDEPRVRVQVGDVRDVVASAPRGGCDLVLLDVDNGPDFLVHDDNAAVYGAAFLTRCRDALAPGGALAVWSSTPAEALQVRMTEVLGGCDPRPVPVTLQGRDERYWLLTSKMDA